MNDGPARDRAQGYDDRVAAALPGYHALHHLAPTIVAAEMGDGPARVLVVGAGTGAECLTLARICPTAEIVGIDRDAEMLAVAAGKVRAAGLGERIRLVRGDAATLPPSDRFTAATMLLVLHFVPDDGGKAGLLTELSRRLVPGAPLVLADLFGDPGDPAHATARGWWRRMQHDAGFDPAGIERGFRHVAREIHPLSEARLATLLAETGFTPPERFFQAFCFGGWVTRRQPA